MAKNIQEIAAALGAEVREPVPDVGGGAFGAARLAQIVAARLRPSRGSNGKATRSGRPAVVEWSLRSKVPMSRTTANKLKRLARQASTPRRKVTAMQLAAQLLEDAVASLDSTTS